MSDNVLVGCKNNASSKKKKKKFESLEEKVKILMNDLSVREEANRKGKGRSASEAGLPVEEENPSKVDRTISPPKL